MNGYSTHLSAREQESSHKLQFSPIPRTLYSRDHISLQVIQLEYFTPRLLGGFGYLRRYRYSQHITRPFLGRLFKWGDFFLQNVALKGHPKKIEISTGVIVRKIILWTSIHWQTPFIGILFSLCGVSGVEVISEIHLLTTTCQRSALTNQDFRFWVVARWITSHERYLLFRILVSLIYGILKPSGISDRKLNLYTSSVSCGWGGYRSPPLGKKDSKREDITRWRSWKGSIISN